MNKFKNKESEDSLKLKNIIIEKNVNDFNAFIKEKNIYIQEIIRRTIISIKKNKSHEIFSNSDVTLSINILNELYEKTKEINLNEQNDDTDKLIEYLQKIINKLSMIICGFGTSNINDLLFISLGPEFINMKINDLHLKEKYDILSNYLHPIGYKIIAWKQNKPKNKVYSLCCSKITDEILTIESANMFECFDTDSSVRLFYQKIYGIRVVIQNEKLKKTLIINCIIDDVQLECFSNEYVNKRFVNLNEIAERLQEKEKEVFKRIIDSLTLKDVLIYSDEDVYKKMIAAFAEINMVKNNKLDVTIKRFLEMDLFTQRNLLLNLLTFNDDEIQYICYLLYDLISVNSIDNIDTREQIMIYDSLPWKIKSYFKDAVKYTMKYTQDCMQKYDINKITLEQQIYLLNVNDNVKEKAMAKLKEVKGKSDETGSKAKQYLEGLIKIPFGIYKEEPILNKIKEINVVFSKLIQNNDILKKEHLYKKDKYTNVEMVHFINNCNKHIVENIENTIYSLFINLTLKQLSTVTYYINNVKKVKKETKVTLANKNKKIDLIVSFIKENTKNETVLIDIYDLIQNDNIFSLSKTFTEMRVLKTNILNIETNMDNISNFLNESIHGHTNAKNQILKIIAQWMNGEQSGYSFGFEGSPGIGKTSLAKKGLSNCLKDGNGVSRPYSFIALGGSSTGTTLEGHGYTYVNSTWGKIVDILIESKCMNPIIYIDELDKVSKTEQGREIIGILTHLIDPTQNDAFQDKYFSGINIDLSKALFIFSYNDAEQIDKILLDRIHRIKFDNLSLDDKIIIMKKYILPEMNKKMGFENIIEISDEIIEHIIETYTLEPGVRKLKEIIFDLFGEINIELLKCKNIDNFKLPIVIDIEVLENKYLNKQLKVIERVIHKEPTIGVINGLWANSLGRGGITPIQAMFFPSTTFLDLKLTGLQGDVMKESMNVAKTLGWFMTPLEVKKEWIKHFEETKCQGLHIHCPDAAVSKDGPSAGAAITIAIYSILNKKLIKNDVAMTGEINLQGEITAIGGLESKLLYGIKNGVKTFLYPESNNKDFKEFMKKYEMKNFVKDICFYEVNNINNIFEYVFV